MATTTTSIEQLSINTIRTLSMDAVQAANSGHPGTPSPHVEFRRLDTDRLRAVLTELTACRQLLDSALKDG